jgi:hypothetical protein
MEGGIMSKWVTSTVVAVLLLSGTATVSAQPGARLPAGAWEGIITGREMADVKGCCNEQAVRLVVNNDGTWTMRTSSWQAAGTTTSRSGSFDLEGDFIAGNPAEKAGPALYHLDQVSLAGTDVLMGNASARYNGVHIVTGIILKKMP